MTLAGRLFHGWVVVGAAHAVMFVGFGSAYTFASFFEPLGVELDATRATLSLVFSIAGALYFLLGLPAGALADRFGPRFPVLIGMVIVGLGMIAAGRAQALWQIYLAYGLGIGIGVGLAYAPAVGAVQPWFWRRRGFASGLAVAGIGMGTLIMPPVAVWLIGWLGWRTAYLVLGLCAIVLGGAAALLIENAPRRRGLWPDGAEGPPADPAGVSARAVPLSKAWRTPAFRWLYAGNSLVSVGLFVPFVHLVPYARGEGIPLGTAVLLFSAIGIGSTFGRFALGGLADRWGRRRSITLLYSGLAAMGLWWLVSTSAWQLLLFSLVYGTCYGGYVALLPALAADYFGGRHVSAIIGALYTSVALGTLIGPPLAGLVYDLTSGYQWAIAAGALLAALGAICVSRAPEVGT
jgi:MFS family permease